jgi:hypothetical protein
MSIRAKLEPEQQPQRHLFGLAQTKTTQQRQ